MCRGVYRREEQHIPPPRPQWLADLEDRGAVVEIVVKPRRAVVASKATSEVFVNDVPVAVLPEKDSLAALGRRELEDERLQSLPVLARLVLFSFLVKATMPGADH